MYSARPNSGGSVRETSVRTDSKRSTFTFWGWNINFWAENFTMAGAKRGGVRRGSTRSRMSRGLRSRQDHRYRPLATGYGRP